MRQLASENFGACYRTGTWQQVRSNGPTAAGVMIRVNPAMWVIYYSYEYVVRNVFWVPGK